MTPEQARKVGGYSIIARVKTVCRVANTSVELLSSAARGQQTKFQTTNQSSV